jgi:uncharacterized protein DUF2325
MNPNASHSHARDTVVIIGGKGGLEARYREAVEASGYALRYYEARVPNKLLPAAGKIALVIVIVTMVSHPLMTRARELAGNHTRIVYLTSSSSSAVRQTIAAPPLQTAAARARRAA